MTMFMRSWARGRAARSSEEQVPLLTVYNPRTHQHEQLPAWEVDELIEQGRIETVTGGGPEHTETRRRLL